MDLDIEGFVRDGHVAVRGAFDAGTAAACREMIWAALGERGVREDDPATWPPLVHIDSLGGGPFAAAGTSPVLAAAYDELIGPGRWAPQVHAGGAVVVRFPSQDRANAGYHIEGSYDGPGGYWVNFLLFSGRRRRMIRRAWAACGKARPAATAVTFTVRRSARPWPRSRAE